MDPYLWTGVQLFKSGYGQVHSATGLQLFVLMLRVVLHVFLLAFSLVLVAFLYRPAPLLAFLPRALPGCGGLPCTSPSVSPSLSPCGVPSGLRFV